MTLTREQLIEILQQQPEGTKILIEDFNGEVSDYLKEEDVTRAWEREAYNEDGIEEGTEHVMMFTKYRE